MSTARTRRTSTGPGAMERAAPLSLTLAAFLLLSDCAAWTYALLEMVR